MLKSNKLCKYLDKKKILEDINLNIEKGAIFGLVGINGAGKTTLINTLTGLYKADSGSVTILDENPYNNINIKQQISYLPEEYAFPEYLTGKQIISRYMCYYDNFSKSTYEKIKNKFSIDDKVVGKKLSKGMKTQLMLAIKLSTNPKILFLDEPTSGLDPINQQVFFDVLIELVTSSDMTVLLSSHYVEGIEKICDEVGVLSDGKLDFMDTVDHIKGNYYQYTASSIISDSKLKNIATSTYNNLYIGNHHDYIMTKYEDRIIDYEQLNFPDVISLFMKGEMSDE